MRIANPFRYTDDFKLKYLSQMSVYKLQFGKKYLIVMCKALHQSVNQMSVELDRRLRLGVKGPDDMFYNVVPHIRRARVTIMDVEVICQPETELDLLKCYFKAILGGEKDEWCLNTTFDINVPQWVSDQSTEAFIKWTRTQTKKKPKNHRRESNKTKNAKAGPKGTGGRKAGVRSGKR